MDVEVALAFMQAEIERNCRCFLEPIRYDDATKEKLAQYGMQLIQECAPNVSDHMRLHVRYDSDDQSMVFIEFIPLTQLGYDILRNMFPEWAKPVTEIKFTINVSDRHEAG